MATSTLKVTNTFTATNGLQPNRSTPVDIPESSNSTATQVFETTLIMPAGSDLLTLSFPSNWSNVYQLTIVNTHASLYVSVNLPINSAPPPYTPVTAAILPPNGGTFAMSTVPSSEATGFKPLYTQLQQVTSAGAVDTNGACTVYVYATGA